MSQITFAPVNMTPTKTFFIYSSTEITQQTVETEKSQLLKKKTTNIQQLNLNK